MPDLSSFKTDELKDRVSTLLDQLDLKLKEAGPVLEKIGRLREEVRVIVDEIESRKNV